MRHPFRCPLLLLPIAFLLFGCQSIPKKGGFADVAEIIEKRSTQRIHWIQDASEDAKVAEAVKELLAKDLSIDAAVQISLLNNRSLQANYESLGVAQAELAKRRAAEHYRKVLIPLREQIVAESQKHYNFMLIGVFQLIEAKQLRF